MAEHEPITNATGDKEVQIPEWDNAAVANQGHGNAVTAGGPANTRLRSKLDAILPPHRRYLGLSRRVFFWALVAATLALLALIIGLAAGLTAHSK